MSLDFEYRLAARDDRLAEQYSTGRCDDCGGTDNTGHTPRCPYWLNELGGREQLAFTAAENRERSNQT